MIGRPDLLEDARFKTDIDRGNNGRELTDIVETWTRERTREEALAAFAAAKVPAAPVLKPQAALDDPHINALEFFQAVPYPGMEKPAPIAKVPIWFSETQGAIRHRAPTIGEHTDQVMSSLGYTQREIEELKSRGVI